MITMSSLFPPAWFEKFNLLVKMSTSLNAVRFLDGSIRLKPGRYTTPGTFCAVICTPNLDYYAVNRLLTKLFTFNLHP